MLIGIMLVVVGAMGGFEKKLEAAATHTEVLRRIVKVRCEYCNTPNFRNKSELFELRDASLREDLSV